MQQKKDTALNEEKRSFDSPMAEPKNSEFRMSNSKYEGASLSIESRISNPEWAPPSNFKSQISNFKFGSPSIEFQMQPIQGKNSAPSGSSAVKKPKAHA